MTVKTAAKAREIIGTSLRVSEALHAANAVVGLVRRQLSSELFGGDVRLKSSVNRLLSRKY